MSRHGESIEKPHHYVPQENGYINLINIKENESFENYRSRHTEVL